MSQDRAGLDAASDVEGAVVRLLGLMAALRTPGSGCPWDLEQTFATIVPYTIEEAYEVADAVARDDLDGLRDELGDLLLQVVFHARMAEEIGAFRFEDVVEGLSAKLLRRHPHVFGDRAAFDAERVRAIWDEVKRAEAAAKAPEPGAPPRTLAGVAAALPALSRAYKLSRKAAGVGFDWPDRAEVAAKVREELAEVEEACASGSPEAVAEEVGDLLFSVSNLARHAGVDPETALRAANAKFERRFGAMEDRLRRDGVAVQGAGLAAMEAAWTAVKADERDAAERHVAERVSPGSGDGPGAGG